MKVTATIPDDLINEIKHYTQGKNVTECLVVALKEWLSLKKIIELNKLIEKKPLKFNKSITSESIREINRKK